MITKTVKKYTFFPALTHSDVVLILLINAKMPKIARILTFMSWIHIYEQGKFHSLKKHFITSNPVGWGYFVKNMIQTTPLMRNMLVRTIQLKLATER